MAKEARVSILITAKDATGAAINSARAKLAALKNSTVASMLGIQGAIGALLGGVLVAKVSSFVLNTTREFERLTGQLRTFTGSAEAAAAKFQELDFLADTLPFELGQVTQGWLDLRRIGLDPTVTVMERLADHASSFSGTIDELTGAVASAAVGMTKPLERFGITMRAEGDKLKATYNGVTETIDRDTQSIVGYMLRVSEANFSGAAARAMDTLDGKLSNLQDNLDTLATIISTGGVRDGFASLVTQTNDLTESVIANGATIQWWTRLIIDLGAAVFQTVWMPIRVVFNAATSAVAIVYGLVTSFTGGISQLVGEATGLLADFIEFVTRSEATTLRAIEGRVKDFTNTIATANRSAWGQVVQDGADTVDALYNLGNAYLGVARAATAAVDATVEFSGTSGRALSDQERTIDLLRTQAQHAGELETRQTALNQLLEERKKIQADLDAGFKAGKDMTDPAMKRAAGLLSGIDATVASVRRGSGEEEEDALKKRIDLLARAAQHDRTRARALRELAKLEGELQRKLERGKLTYEEQVELEDRRAKILETLRGVEEARQKEEDDRLQLLVEAAGHESTRAEAIPRLVEEEQRLTAALQNQNLTLAERVRLERQRLDVREGITSGTDRITAERIDLLARATQLTATRAGAIAELRQIEARLNDEVARGITLTRDGVATGERLAQVRAMIASATTGALAAEVDQGVALMRHDATRAQGRAKLEEAERKLQAAIAGTQTPVEELGSLYDQLEEVQERLGRSNAWQRIARQMVGTRTSAERLRDTIDTISSNTLSSYSDAITTSMAATVTGSENAGRAFSSAIVGAVAAGAKAMGDMFMGHAAASLASIFAPPPMGPNPGGAAAAAGYSAAATAMYALSGVASGQAQKIGSGGSNARGGIGDRTSSELADAKGAATLVIEGGILDMSDPRQEAAFARALENLSGRRVTVKRG